jgi:hypothetical protein
MEVDMGRFTFAFAFILATAPAFAHDSKGPNGGRITDLGRFHAELTTKGNTVELYVTDSANKAMAMDGYKGLAVIVVGGKSERIDLAPVRGNKLAGTATVAIPPNAKGVVRLNAPNGNTSQAEFD